ncbi:hypothetical protein RND81_08G120300 [Saponaria officinalis]|uniref:MINDY deubiquitinase domain-containing protein n=1 Tax=Saponaria officinalis TaxID=3572 RepID=A0AAW1J7U3_SAPOF
MASSSEEQPQTTSEASSKDQQSLNDVVIHKTKTIQFFGRSSPIVLQNDNGPCPLIAICNVLLLRNQLNLSAAISEVSQEKLLSLVAERLIDSNSNNKDAEYVKNQQQNIADAIDLLPRLTTGIDVNTKFRRIDDFEFTRECAIFDLLDIPLYHGWLVDPQDHDTAEAIGSKSYNAIMGDLVLLETRKMENEGKDRVEEDCVDFAAATTATLGVPSPNHLRNKSLDYSPRSGSDQHSPRKGDVEEEEELLRVLKMSEDDIPTNVPTTSSENVSCSDENLRVVQSTLAKNENVTEVHSHVDPLSLEPSVSGSNDVSGNCETNAPLEDRNAVAILRDDQERQNDNVISVKPFEGSMSNDDVVTCPLDTPISCEATPPLPPAEANVPCQKVESLSSIPAIAEELHEQNGEENETPVAGVADSGSSGGRIPSVEAAESFTSSLDDREPIYEGEECIQGSSKSICDQEPVYEGEVVLAEQAGNGAENACDESSKDAMTFRHGELATNFFKSNASQLTFYGLFCLQEGLKERELCVFFRNNHFSTMFKFEGELYILATDQGYLNQPDLVWEKLNEVNGDTLFMTCNFKEFRMDSSTNGTWDQQNAVANTADYLASIDSSSPDGSNMTSDMQLAIALQQQEFDQQQQQQQPQRNQSQQPPAVSSSRLITGPQVSKSSGRATSSASRQDQKSKDKSSNCKLM